MSLKRARSLRRTAPATERMLWRFLRDGRFGGLKFRRQVPMGPYVLDFACLRHRLVLELDGPFHDPGRDRARDLWLASRGFRVLRFSNAEVTPERVFAAISEAVDAPRDGRF